jgi:hypothetical protein
MERAWSPIFYARGLTLFRKSIWVANPHAPLALTEVMDHFPRSMRDWLDSEYVGGERFFFRFRFMHRLDLWSVSLMVGNVWKDKDQSLVWITGRATWLGPAILLLGLVFYPPWGPLIFAILLLGAYSREVWLFGLLSDAITKSMDAKVKNVNLAI